MLVVSSTLRGALHGLRPKFNGPRGKVPARQRYRAESMRDHASGLHAKLAEQSERYDETAEQRLLRQLAEQAECSTAAAACDGQCKPIERSGILNMTCSWS